MFISNSLIKLSCQKLLMGIAIWGKKHCTAGSQPAICNNMLCLRIEELLNCLKLLLNCCSSHKEVRIQFITHYVFAGYKDNIIHAILKIYCGHLTNQWFRYCLEQSIWAGLFIAFRSYSKLPSFLRLSLLLVICLLFIQLCCSIIAFSLFKRHLKSEGNCF